MTNPYRDAGAQAFWRPAVASLDPSAWRDVYRKKFAIGPDAAVATAGSCFAQHLGRHLRARFRFVDTEPAPPSLPREVRPTFGYGLFSARYGNVYSAAHLRQLAAEALGAFTPVDRVWHHEGRWYDPYRPTIEPNGFGSADEVRVLREAHLQAVREMLRTTDVFVFTLGVTETWRSTIDGAVYQTCPGTVGGTFDAARHRFHNCTVADVRTDISEFVRMAHQLNPAMTFILTVSPVPLTATATERHVLAATIHSKSVLRAACGELEAGFDCIDYFPSYELIVAPPVRARFYDDNLRTITAEGVEFVMSHFLEQHPGQERVSPDEESDTLAEVICDEAELDRLWKRQ